MMKKVSVIMPAYNVAPWIERSIESVLKQSYTNFSLIIVNDGSIDDTGDIADKYARQDSRVSVIHQTNAGLSAARNSGIKRMDGDFVVFIDSDDYWESTLLEETIKYINENALDITVFGHYIDYYDRANKLTKSSVFTEGPAMIDRASTTGATLRNPAILGYAWNKVYASKLFLSDRLRFEEGTSYVEDVLFNSRAFTKAEKIGLLNRPLYHYAQRELLTLGNSYYPNICELDNLAVQSSGEILSALNISNQEIKRYKSKMFFDRCRYSIGIIANTNCIDRKTKKAEIYMMLDELEKSYSSLPSQQNFKTSLYLFLFKHRLINTLLFIENIKANNLKRYLLDRLPNKLKANIKYRFIKKDAYRNLDKSARKIVITLAADYGNLGDLAITHAMHRFFEDKFPEYEIVEVPVSDTYSNLKSLKSKLTHSDIVTIVGGGNMGNLYPDIEAQRQLVIREFKENNIVSFPQTLYITDDASGKRSLKKITSVYNSHKKLILLARESTTFHYLNDVMQHNPTYLTPDIVLYLKEAKNSQRNKNLVTICLREDVESALDDSKKSKLIKYLKDDGFDLQYKDTHIGPKKVRLEDRERELSSVWNSFRASRLVITDRLHGMIFCAITKTPCIAINNNNDKVKDFYSTWLAKTDYIMFMDGCDLATIKKSIHKLLTSNNKPFQYPPHDDEFNKLEATISSVMRKEESHE